MIARDDSADSIGTAKLASTEHSIAEKAVIVSHTGRRDSYELAYALSLSGRPVHLITDFFYNPATFGGRLAHIFFGDVVKKRYRSDLTVTVHSSPLLLFTDFVERAFPRRKWVNMLRGWALGQRCLGVARRHRVRDIYTYYNSGARQILREHPEAHVTVFQMHPHPDSLTRIYERYLARRPELRILLTSQEEEMTSNSSYYDRLSQDARLAHSVLCTSSFTRETLIAAGVPETRISVVPYGTHQVEERMRHVSEVFTADAGGIHLAFVGQFVLRKGVYELLSVARARPEVRLEVFSREAAAAQRLAEDWLGSLPSNIVFRKILDDSELWSAVAQADFLALPSLAEGFGLVISEAMTHGLPVIATRHTAAPDLIEDGRSGFLIEGFFEEDISRAIDRALAAREQWPYMRAAALEDISGRTWPAFRDGILAHLERNLNGL